MFLEHVERARELSRDVNILDLEVDLSKEMSTIGFIRIFDADLTTITCPQTEYIYSELEFMDMGHQYFPKEFHDEEDKLIYRNSGTTILLRKRRIENPNFWKKCWGVDISLKYDLSNVPDLTYKPAMILPINQEILDNLFKKDRSIGVSNAFDDNNAQENSPIIYINGHLVYHQYLKFLRQSGLIGKFKSEFITKVAESIRRIVFVNEQYLRYQLRVRESLENEKKAFELIL